MSTDAWAALQRAAEDYTKWFDGDGTATDQEATLRAAAVAYAKSSSPMPGSAPLDDVERATMMRVVSLAVGRAEQAEFANAGLASQVENLKASIRQMMAEREEAGPSSSPALSGQDAIEALDDVVTHATNRCACQGVRDCMAEIARISSPFTREAKGGG